MNKPTLTFQERIVSISYENSFNERWKGTTLKIVLTGGSILIKQHATEEDIKIARSMMYADKTIKVIPVEVIVEN